MSKAKEKNKFLITYKFMVHTMQNCYVCGHRVPKTLVERIHRCPYHVAFFGRGLNPIRSSVYEGGVVHFNQFHKKG